MRLVFLAILETFIHLTSITFVSSSKDFFHVFHIIRVLILIILVDSKLHLKYLFKN